MAIVSDKKSHLTSAEFERICRGIDEDREKIIRHNPIGTDEEILLWMLMCVLISYLSVPENEVPCFPGTPDQTTYLAAIDHLLSTRHTDFEWREYVEKMLAGFQ
ncbi:MAG: hypothetical protein R2684_12830 [Pyrinomonadaceae bacterium]